MNSLWDAEAVVCVSCPSIKFSADKPVKKCYAAVTSTGDLEGFSFSCFLCGWGQWGDRCRSLPSASVASKAVSQQRRNKSFISFSSLHVFVAVWQRNHLFPVDGSLPALHTNRVHHVAGGDTSSFTHLRTFVFGRITSLWKRWHLGQWVFSNRPSQF